MPFKDIKFTLDKILTCKLSKPKLKNYNLHDKLEVSPLGVFPQNINFDKKTDLNEPIIFISCGNLIELKITCNDRFLRKFSEQTNKKVKHNDWKRCFKKKFLKN